MDDIEYIWNQGCALPEPLLEPFWNRVREDQRDPFDRNAQKLVKGRLPENALRAGKAYVEAENNYMEAMKAWGKARRAVDECWKLGWGAPAYWCGQWRSWIASVQERAVGQTRRKMNKARKVYEQALKDSDKEIRALHAKEMQID